jgi:hypothetical protein
LGCGEAAKATSVLELRVHSLPSCNLPPALSRGSVELLALGDFEPTNDSAEVLPIAGRGAALKFPAATQAVAARVENGSEAFSGYAERHGSAGLDLLLWPEGTTCAAWLPSELRYPGRNGGQALAYAPETGGVLAVGGNDARVSDAIVGLLSFDTATGAASALGADAAGELQEPRAFATLTRFGDGFLVAGGEHPLADVPELELDLSSTAEVYDDRLGRFTGETIQLRNTRTHHAALTLEDGRTLLVGGRTKVGAANIAQYQLEIVDPSSKRAAIAGEVAGRIDARALRLSDGRIFVGGGTGSHGAPTEPVGEWLSREAKLEPTRLSLEVAPRFERAFVATAGGGVLAVGGCEDRPAQSDDDDKACKTLCAHGCPPLDGYDAWWIDRDGNASRVALEQIAAPRPLLLPGSDGSPWLIAADARAPQQPRLFRFNPWGRDPVTDEPAPRFEPVLTPDTLRLPRPGMPAPLAIDSDAYVWTDDDGEHGALFGLRLGSRSRYAQDVSLVLSSEELDPTRPEHLVPTRPPNRAASYDGWLTLRGASSRGRAVEPAVTVQVADTDYADVTVTLHLRSGDPPLVVLGESLLGGSDCPWPDAERRGGDFELPQVLRSKTRAVLRLYGGETSCTVAAGRLTLGLRAAAGETVLTALDVVRGIEPR